MFAQPWRCPVVRLAALASRGNSCGALVLACAGRLPAPVQGFQGRATLYWGLERVLDSTLAGATLKIAWCASWPGEVFLRLFRQCLTLRPNGVRPPQWGGGRDKAMRTMSYLFTSESVSSGHPDKVADQISDALLDEFLRRDAEAKVACETFVTTGLVVLCGEIRTKSYVDVQQVARRVIHQIGYDKAEYMFDGSSCGVLSSIHEQSPDIIRGVERTDPLSQGAGDQGMMFGFACRETQDYMPLPIELAHVLLMELEKIRREGLVMTYLRPDAKSQVTLEYAEDGKPLRVHTLVISAQHDEFADDEKMQRQIAHDVRTILIPRVLDRLEPAIRPLFEKDFRLLVNPTGKFVVGGPHGDTGLTGRKIIVDTYGGRAAHGGGAFSGKDSSKVDRSATYAARHMAKNLVAAGVADSLQVQLAYAIGVAEPVSVAVNTFGTAKVDMSDGEIAEVARRLFDLRPGAIVRRLGLKLPIYLPTAAYGHFGRTPYEASVDLLYDDKPSTAKADFFAWEKLDYGQQVRDAFKL